MTLDFLSIAADILDPPGWEPPDRPPLQPHQIPPPLPWKLWVLMGGRGSGKTEAASRYFSQWMHDHPGHRGRIVGPTLGDVVESCIEGPSGLLAIDPDVKFYASAPGGSKVKWPNGSEAILLGTDRPGSADRFRAGGNRHIDWWEEMASCRYLMECWEQAEFGLRLGDRPHSIASTTPKNRKPFRILLNQDGTKWTHGTIDDNPHLDDEWKETLKKKYGKTRIGRQELLGHLLEDIEGALWRADWIDRGRVFDPPKLVRIVVAIDVATTKTESSDETGIIAVGMDARKHCYVLADMSGKYTPNEWAKKVIFLYDNLEADAIVYEANNGGDMIPTVIMHMAQKLGRARLPIKKVSATRDKKTRAEPVAHQYEIEPATVHHVDYLVELEDQLTTWDPMEDKESPDRLDALVWAVTFLVNKLRNTLR